MVKQDGTKDKSGLSDSERQVIKSGQSSQFNIFYLNLIASMHQRNAVLKANVFLGKVFYYYHDNNELIWEDKSINFIELPDDNNRRFHILETVSTAITWNSDNNILALIGKKLCLVDHVRSTCKCIYINE